MRREATKYLHRALGTLRGDLEKYEAELAQRETTIAQIRSVRDEIANDIRELEAELEEAKGES